MEGAQNNHLKQRIISPPPHPLLLLILHITFKGDVGFIDFYGSFKSFLVNKEVII